MSRGGRIARNISIGIVALIAVAIIAALIVVRTTWFRSYIAQDIVSSIEESTGGRAEIGSFDFDASHLRVTIRDLVIHGREPAGSAPLVRVNRIVAEFRLFTHFSKLLDIRYLGVDQPQANVRILANGQTNIPSPKQKSTSNKSPLQTVVDLAVGRFELSNGSLALESMRQPLNVRGTNLRAQLSWNLLSRTYGGEVSLKPLYVVAGRNTPVTFTVTLPVTIGSDRIDLHRANISTSASSLLFDASVQDLKNPRVTAQINGTVAVADLKNAGDLSLTTNTRGVPAQIDLNANLTEANGVIRIADFQMHAGQSSIRASGSSDRAIAFTSRVDLDELGRLIKVSSLPPGVIGLNGDAHFDAAKRDLDLTNLDLSALGGHFLGAVSLQDFRNYRVEGSLRNLDIATVLRAFHEQVPWDGIISGPVSAAGDIEAMNTLRARAELSISRGSRGQPVSGRINANYDAASNDVTFEKSFLALPHSRAELNGSLNKVLNVSLQSRDLHDFPGTSAVGLDRGQVNLTAAVTGGLKSPRITGHLAANGLTIEGREFDSVAADLRASRTGATVQNGVLTRSSMQAHFSAATGLADWKPLPREPISATLSINNGDLADVVALAGMSPSGYSGMLNANADIKGTIGNPVGDARIQADRGSISGQAFDHAQVQVHLADQLVTIPAAYIQSGGGRVDLNAQFRHPRDSFTTGHVEASAKSNAIDLSTLASAREANTSGTAQIDATVAGDLNKDGFLLTAANASASARALRYQNQNYGDLQATAQTSGQAVTYNLTSDFAGSNVRVNGRTQLTRDYPTTADASISNLAVDKVLAAAKRTDIPARGTLSGSAHVTGTVHDPRAEVNLTLARGAVYDEPVDELRLRGSYLARSIDIAEFRVSSGPSRIELTAHYDHPAGDLSTGNAQFNVESSRIDLARIHNVQSLRPGLAGTIQLTGHGNGSIVNADPRVQLRELAMNLSATGIAAQGKRFGDLKLSANSASGSRIEFALDSTLADASIHGSGNATLTAGYPVDAKVTFSNVLYSHFAKLLGTADEAQRSAEIATDGEITVNGPVLNQDQLRASLQLTRLNVTVNQAADHKPVIIANQGPISVALERGRIQVQSAHVAGAGSDLTVTGNASLTDRTLGLNVNGKANLDFLSMFNQDIYSSGGIELAAVVRGTMSQPLVNGQMTLQNAALNYAGLPVGLSKANGQIAFEGNRANIRTLTAEAGGGKLTLSGFASYSDRLRFSLQMKANRVRARSPEGVSVTANADVQLTGSDAGSLVSGTGLIDQVTYNSRTDIGSVLSRSVPVSQSDGAESPLLEKMRLDIRVRAASSLIVQSEMAQNLSATVDLRVVGTAAQPGITGRITITEGQLLFFGAQYKVNNGTIAFYNPLQINPNVDLSLETQTQGVDVTLHVTGPMDNLKLSYTSNPPLQFQEIVGLLAAGKAPTSDPTLLANQPNTPPASFQQMGESALLGQAVANPVANRLQRVFGVSQLRIAPSFQTGSQTPTARITLQQRITSNLTFTYTSALDDPNGEIVSVQWTFDPRWSAVATRDQNGIFSINFLYQRQFR